MEFNINRKPNQNCSSKIKQKIPIPKSDLKQLNFGLFYETLRAEFVRYRRGNSEKRERENEKEEETLIGIGGK